MRNAVSAAIVSLAGITIFQTAGCVADAPEEQKLPWHDTIETALEEANERGTLIVVDVYTATCAPCIRFEKETLSDPHVQEKLKDFTRFKLDGDKHSQMLEGYGVQGYPSVLVLDKNGKLIHREPGFMGVDQFLRFLSSLKDE